MRLRLLDHRGARAAVDAGPTRSFAVDTGAGIRRGRRVATDAAPSAGSALNDGARSARSGWLVRGRDTAAGDRAAAAQRGTFLTEDAAVSPAPGAHSGTCLAAQPGSAADTAARMPAQTSAARHSRGRRCWSGVSAQGAGIAAQHGGAAFAADAQSRTTGSAEAGLAADADAAERARHVGSGGAVQRGAFASD